MISEHEKRLLRKQQALRHSTLFGGLASNQVEDLLGCALEVSLAGGETLFSAGEPSKGMYLVVSGRTRAIRHGADGREQIMHEDGHGATFPEVAVFDGGPYPSTVVAVTDATLLFLPKKEVQRICLAYPQVALAALSVLSKRLRKATGMVEDFSLRDVGQRLGEYLLEEARSRGRESRSGFELELRHTNQEIADLIGSVREVISRAFAKLQRKELIEKEGRVVRIIDAEGLEEFSQ